MSDRLPASAARAPSKRLFVIVTAVNSEASSMAAANSTAIDSPLAAAAKRIPVSGQAVRSLTQMTAAVVPPPPYA